MGILQTSDDFDQKMKEMEEKMKQDQLAKELELDEQRRRLEEER